MKLWPVFFVLYFVQISYYNNNPDACFSCIAKLITKEACNFVGCDDQNSNSNTNNVDTNAETNPNFHSVVNNTKQVLEQKAVEVLDTISKTLINMWDTVFPNSGNHNDNNISHDSTTDDPNYNSKKKAEDEEKRKEEELKKKTGLENPENIKLINQFFATLSQNQVQNILTSTPNGFLIDEIYVTGLWDKAFDPTKTAVRSFYLTTRAVKIPTMFNRGLYRYGSSQELDASILELPFDDGNGSLLLVLPSSPDGIVDLMNQLQTPPLLDNAVAQMDMRNVDVYLPKFQVETMFDLKLILGKIAIPGVTLRSVSQGFQKVIIEINEEGKPGTRRSNPLNLRQRIVQFRAQWPFYYELRFYKKPIFNGVYGIK